MAETRRCRLALTWITKRSLIGGDGGADRVHVVAAAAASLSVTRRDRRGRQRDGWRKMISGQSSAGAADISVPVATSKSRVF